MLINIIIIKDRLIIKNIKMSDPEEYKHLVKKVLDFWNNDPQKEDKAKK